MSIQRPSAGLRAAVLAGLLTALAWSPSLRNGFCWDDRQLVVENEAITGPDAVTRAFATDFWESEERAGSSDYWRPLITISYVLDRRLHGLAPAGYHASNVAAHAAAVTLLALLLLRLGAVPLAAGAAALLFGVHPALAESVAWVAGRTDVLAALFVLAYLLVDGASERSPARRIAASAALALALLCKETAVVAPLLSMLLLRPASWRDAARQRWEQGALLLCFFVARRLVLGAAVADELHLASGLSIPVRLLAFPQVAGILLAPWWGRIEYGAGLPVRALLPGAAAGLAVLAGAGWLLERARRRGGLDSVAALAACGSICLLPAAGALLLKSVMGDRLSYLAAAFLVPAAALLLAGATPRLGPARVAALAAIVLAATLGSLGRQDRWRNERTLFEAASRAPFPSARVWLNLGIAQHDEGLLPESFESLHRAVAEAPLKGGHYTLGLIHTEIGCDDLAIRHYGLALRHDPYDLSAANNLGALLAELGRAEEARQVLGTALRTARGGADELRTNLRSLLGPGAQSPSRQELRCGDDGQARLLLRDARQLNRRALDRLKRQQVEQAGILARAALHVDPALTAARLNLAQWRTLRGEPDLACDELRSVLRREPENEAALRMLAWLEGAPLPALPLPDDSPPPDEQQGP
jgi:tetratricopeptide (TPR) repeat protein